jgi:membrane-bound lytic murein transglycosylase MltF
VSNRSDPIQSIQGGAKYFDLMLDQFSNVPYPDRNWYALVAYNMGPGAVNQIQNRIKTKEKPKSMGKFI